jgi:hypothetical protein
LSRHEVDLAAPLDHYPEIVRGTHIEKVPELLQLARTPLAGSRDLSARIKEAEPKVRDKAALAREVEPSVERLTRQYDDAVERLQKARDAKEREIDGILTPATADTAAAEIRAHFKGRGQQAFTELSALVRAGDRRATAAVLSSPAYLSGLTVEQQGILRTQARITLAPEQHGLSGDLEQAIERVRAAGAAFVMRVGGELHKWRRPDREIAAIKKGLTDGQ